MGNRQRNERNLGLPVGRVYAQAKNDRLRLSIYGAIGDDFFDEGVTTKAVSDILNANPNARELEVAINSSGGLAHEGVGIYNVLRRFADGGDARTSKDIKGRFIDVVVEGFALSAASVVAMAGDEITMAVGSSMMIHEPWGLAMGPADELRQQADRLDHMTGTVVEVYRAHNENLTAKRIRELMAAETWMDGHTAVELGFATRVSKDVLPAAASYDSRLVKRSKDLEHALARNEHVATRLHIIKARLEGLDRTRF